MSGENCENCGSSRLKDFKYRDGYGCWDCGYTSDDKNDKMACSECDSFVEDGSCLCGKTRIETIEDLGIRERSDEEIEKELKEDFELFKDALKQAAEETSEKSENVERDRKTGLDSSNEIEELEPAAWMELDDLGGAGLVPHLTKVRAERGTHDNRQPEYPKPLFYLESSERHPPATGILDLWDEAIEHLEAMKCGEDGCEKCIGIDQALTAVRARRDKLEEFTQKGGSGGS